MNSTFHCSTEFRQFIKMVYAELGSAIPEAGGGYLWVKEGLSGPNVFLAGWMSWFAHAVAGSLYGLGIGSYLFLGFEEFGLPTFGLPEEIAHEGLAVLIILSLYKLSRLL